MGDDSFEDMPLVPTLGSGCLGVRCRSVHRKLQDSGQVTQLPQTSTTSFVRRRQYRTSG